MSPERTQQQIEQMVANLFDVDITQVSLASSPTTIEKWDSMGHLMLVMEIEQEFNIQLLPEQVEQMTSIATIVQIIDQLEVA